APRSLLLFSFYYHTPPPDLHSFPTRRSSDLLLPGPDAHGTGGAGGGEADALRGGQPRLGQPDAALAPADGRHRRRRPVGGHGGQGPPPHGRADGAAGRLPRRAGRGGDGRGVSVLTANEPAAPARVGRALAGASGWSILRLD